VVADLAIHGREGQLVIMDRRAGRLLSVNVGLPQDVAWHGQIVHTAV